MKRVGLILAVVTVMVIQGPLAPAQENTSVAIIRSGLLGAGAGAIGGAVSGGDSNDLWISALTGAGVNIIGGSLLDMLTGGTTSTNVRAAKSRPVVSSYSGRHIYQRKSRKKPLYASRYEEGYADGFKEGYLKAYLDAYKRGYEEGYRDGRRR